jgi:hypothetical protein
MADNPFIGTLSVTGNVGIGAEPSPNAPLYILSSEIKNQILVENSTGALLKISLDGGQVEIGIDSGIEFPPSLSLKTNGSTHLSINAAGNVGIGTVPTATEKLSVNGKLQVTTGAIVPSVGNTETSGIMFPKDPAGGSGDAAWIRYYPRTGEATTLEIGTSNDPDDHIALMASGNVGIGTNNPQAKLEVNGAIRAGNSDLYFTKTDHNHTGIGNTAGFAAIENAANFEALMILGRAGTAKGRSVKLWDYLQVNGDLEVTGNVGIGTSNPDRKLVVRGGETSLQQEDWQTPTFQNGWVNYSNDFNLAGYFKDSLGVIHLRGLVKNGSGTIFTLPEGYRPSRRELFGVATNPNVMGRIDVLSDGQVYMVSGNNGWISLDGLTFKAGSRRFFPFPDRIDFDRVSIPINLNP